MYQRFNLIFLALPVILLTISSCGKNDKENFFGRQIKPIIWGSDDLSTKEHLADFQAGKREPHPLDIGKSLIYTAHRYQQTGDSFYKEQSMGYLALIETLYDNPEYYDKNTFKYNFSHNNLKPGWWSGMANSAIVFGLTLCDDVYGTDHGEIVEALIDNLKTDYEEGGCLYPIDENKSWILEYAWPGINKTSVKFVLNGFLYSLICLKMAHNISPNPNLEQLFNKGWLALEHKIDDYYFQGVKWTKYDLNPTIEPPHYAIFDIILLESLASFENGKEEWIEKTLSRRRGILKQAYRLDIAKRESDSYSTMFSLIGPPNPYWIDIYPIEIKINFTDKRGTKIINSYPPKEFEMNIYKRGFISFDLDQDEFSKIRDIAISSKYQGQKQQLFKYSQEELFRNIKVVENKNIIARKALSANYDGVFGDSVVTIEPERTYDTNVKNYKNNVAQIVIPFREVEYFKEDKNLVLKIYNSIEIPDHKFFIHSEDGKVYQQYYKSISKGNNVVVLNPAKFKNYKSNKGIKKIVWQIYTSKQRQKGDVRIDDVFKAKTQIEIEKIRSVKGKTPQKIKTEALSAKFDAICTDSIIKIDSKRLFENDLESYKSGIAQIVIPFSETRHFQENENLVLKMDSDLEIVDHKFFIYNEDGAVFQRYYLPIPKGKNIIILNPVGFKDYDSDKGIKKLVWQIYTSKVEQGEIKIKSILKTENSFQLKNIFANDDYNFEEKIIRGNIY